MSFGRGRSAGRSPGGRGGGGRDGGRGFGGRGRGGGRGMDEGPPAEIVGELFTPSLQLLTVLIINTTIDEANNNGALFEIIYVISYDSSNAFTTVKIFVSV